MESELAKNIIIAIIQCLIILYIMYRLYQILKIIVDKINRNKNRIDDLEIKINKWDKSNTKRDK